jgi:hypothetical protein
MSGVTDLQLDPTGVARRTLDEVARQHGPSALDDPLLLGQLLPDLMAGAQREAALVSAAASAGVGRLLTERVGHGIPTDAAIRDIALVLAQRHAYDIRACDWIVTEYARVLGVPLSIPTVPVAREGNPEALRGLPGTAQNPTGSPNNATGSPHNPTESPHNPTGTTQNATGTVQRSPEHTRIDPGAPGLEPVPARRRGRRTALVVTVVVVLLAAGVGVLLATRKSTPPKTGADCLVGTWRSTSVLLRDGTVTTGGVNVTYHPGGTGDGSVNITEDLSDDQGGVVTITENYTFNYAATDSRITYTNVHGNSVTVGPSGSDPEEMSSLGDDMFTCTGDSLHVDSPDIGGSQTYARH